MFDTFKNAWKVEELRKRLKDSKFFTEESELTDIRRAQNLTSFKLLLNLKESIKK